MEQQRQQSNPIDDTTNLLCEFLEVAVHLVLSVRDIYPPEVFERRRHFNVPVQWARHPELREYIHSATSSLHSWIRQGIVEKVAVVILDNAKVPLERFMFKLRVNQGYGKEFPLHDLEYALRAFFLRLSTSQHLLLPLPPDCSWEIVAYSKQLPGDASSSSQLWIPTDAGTWEQPPVITPIKSMSSEPLDLQLYVEHSSEKALTIRAEPSN